MHAKQSTNQGKILTADRARYTKLYSVGSEDGSGALLTVDPDPNVTPPAANRIYRIGQAQCGTLGALCVLIGWAFDGTPNVQPWMLDEANGRWYKATGATVPLGFFSTVVNVGGGWLGAAFYFQLTAVNASHGFYLFVR